MRAGIRLLPIEAGRLDGSRLLRGRRLSQLHPAPLVSQPGKLSGELQPKSVRLAGIGSEISRLHTFCCTGTDAYVHLGIMRQAKWATEG